MTFLQLCQRLAVEAGLSSSGPSAVTGQTGEAARIVNWVRDAWTLIQGEHDNWQWLWNEFTLNTVSGTAGYSESDISGTPSVERWDERAFSIYLSSDGASTRVPIGALAYPAYRDSYAHRYVADAFPQKVIVLPDNTLRLYPAPDAVYVLGGVYYESPTELAADSDTPAISSKFHMAIVWRALMLYAEYEEAPEVYQAAYSEYSRELGRMRVKYLPQITIDSRPLA